LAKKLPFDCPLVDDDLPVQPSPLLRILGAISLPASKIPPAKPIVDDVEEAWINVPPKPVRFA
jgi:hypothetical protein